MAAESTLVVIVLACMGIIQCQAQVSCSVGEAKLVDSPITGSEKFIGGILEVCVTDNQFRRLHYENFDLQDGHVACSSVYGASSAAVAVIPVNSDGELSDTRSYSCFGTENMLSDCTNSVDRIRTHVVGLVCKKSAEPGDVRLVYSTINDNSGLVQYFTVGSWRYILTPSNGWNNVDANVVCRQLGYASGERISSLNSPSFTADNSISYDSVSCQANHHSFSQCNPQESSRMQLEEAVVECDSGNVVSGAMRLIDSGAGVITGGRNGIVEVFYEGRWGSLCYTSSIGGNEENVICRQLGFHDGGVATNSSLSVQITHPLWGSMFSCRGTEESVLDCQDNGPIGVPVQCQAGNFLEITCMRSHNAPEELGITSGGITAIIVMTLVTFGFVLPFIIGGYIAFKEKNGLDCDCFDSPRTAISNLWSRRGTSYATSQGGPTEVSELPATGLGYEPPEDLPENGDDNRHEAQPNNAELTEDAPPSYQNITEHEKIGQETTTEDKTKDLPAYMSSEKGVDDLPPYPTAASNAAYPPA